MVSASAFRRHAAVMRAVAMLLVRMIRMITVVGRMLDMLRRTPAWLAPEGQEHQAPAVEAGQQRCDRTRPEGDDAMGRSATVSRLENRVLRMIAGEAADPVDSNAGD